VATKTKEDINYNSRLGSLGEACVETLLIEFCDFVTKCSHTTPYDLILDHNNRLYKVQVKTVTQTKTKSGLRYRFHANRPQRSEQYYKSRNDIYALVFYPEKVVLFRPNTGNQRHYTFEKAPSKEEEFNSLQETLEQLNNAPILKPIEE
jgi:hypothetical protein